MNSTSKILVTGGAGFIGSYVVDRLIADGKDVVIFDHTSPGREKLRSSPSEHYLGDIRDEVAVTEAVAHVDGVIHLAGVLGTQETIGNPKPAVMTNITGGLNVLQAASQYDIPMVNIAVGNHWEQNPYSISKTTVERLASMYRKERGLRVSSVRALNAYGPGQSVAAPYGTSTVRKIMPSFVMRALNGVPIQIYGDGQQIMDMIYVSDVADFLVDALYRTASEAFPETIEAGTGRPTTVLDIANEVIKHVPGAQIEHLPMRRGETPNAVVMADTTTQLGLYPNGRKLIALEEGVAQTVRYFRESYSA